MRPPTGHGYAFRCETCDCDPMWRITRRGDAVVTWACVAHLSEACERFQRDWEITELVVTPSAKAREWSQLSARLDAISTDPAAPLPSSGDGQQ